MGRVIKYSVVNKDFQFDEDTAIAVYDLTEVYQKSFEWSNGCPIAFDWDPNWKAFNPRWKSETVYNNIEKIINKAMQMGNHPYETLLRLYKSHKIIMWNENSFHGFVKVNGNEWNALNVIRWIWEVSKMIPDQEINVDDDGKLLTLPITVKNGMAKVWHEKIEKNFAYWRERGYLDLITEIELELAKLSSSKSTTDYIELENFIRPVNKADFDQYRKINDSFDMSKGITAEMIDVTMSGFSGEYWMEDEDKKKLVEENKKRLNIATLAFSPLYKK